MIGKRAFSFQIARSLSYQKRLIIYTDGSCRFNGRSNARAGIGGWFGSDDDPRNFSEALNEGRQTSSRAEIVAAIRALQIAKTHGHKNITIRTDSEFLANSINFYLPVWKVKGWKRADGQKIVNRDDFLLFDENSKNLNVRIEHIYGHKGDKGNESAHKLAKIGVSKHYNVVDSEIDTKASFRKDCEKDKS